MQFFLMHLFFSIKIINDIFVVSHGGSFEHLPTIENNVNKILTNIFMSITGRV